MSLPDYAKPTAGMIIRSIIPASQSVYDIPASYFGIYKLAMGNNTSPVTAGGTLLLFPSAVDYNGVPDDRAGLLIDQYGDVYILSNRNSKWKTLVNTDRTINGYNLSKNVVVNAGDIFSTAKALGNIDLDTLTTPDLYFQSANDNATTARHYPTSLAGSLQIYKDAGVTQIYTAYNGGGQWRRGYYNNVWSEWVTAYDSNNLNPVLTVNNIGPDAKGNVDTNPKINGDGSFSLVVPVFNPSSSVSVKAGGMVRGSYINAATIYSNHSGAIVKCEVTPIAGLWRFSSPVSFYYTPYDYKWHTTAQRVPIGSIEKFSNIRNPRYAHPGSSGGMINITCDIEGVGTDLTFTTLYSDPEPYGQQLYANAAAGMYGEIADNQYD
ncbi:hypothetical protein IDG15_000726 [Salmonella enterica subsp. enterica serovar Enteritidis]|nr:hypothetical protein [Salmonella enterica subsp. enterica serovar Enteritidis]